ncbi:outer membrane protein [Pseudomonas sp. JAI111]|uniref:OmpW/AlkL family protein n=1 Tax=Pseudomonas sp. JAI111 TaxID=2735913 RepID=UPI0021688A72|nr:OmpW family outer membrane protein [Pseudomonas sp. JAI111]MCS3835753.1 outer membrane protein [Pseudomonas sp. JAI111]
MTFDSPRSLMKTGQKNAFWIATWLLLLGVFMVGKAAAEDSPWVLRVGPASVLWDESAKVKLGGASIPGADVNVKDNYSLAFDIGYEFTDNWSTHFAFGIPPKTKLTTAGSLNAARPPLSGTLGEVRYGPAILSAVYKFNPKGSISPYIGAGLTYVYVFSSKDGDVDSLKVDNTWGSVLQAGFTVPLQKNWSFFVDARKLFIKTKASGNIPALGGQAVSASFDLDPLIIHTGLEYHF